MCLIRMCGHVKNIKKIKKNQKIANPLESSRIISKSLEKTQGSKPKAGTRNIILRNCVREQLV